MNFLLFKTYVFEMTISYNFFKGWKLTLLLPVLLLSSTIVQGQELDASVSVDRSQLSSTSLDYLNDFSDKLETYINEYEWTNARFQETERIGMDIQITLLSVDNDYNVDAQIVIQSRRPIYNTTQETALFLFNDSNWQFNYTPNRALMHDQLQFDPLTSLIDFYAYVVLGYDFDSFERFGGTPYFSDAQHIVSLARSASASGWSRESNNRRNRTQLISNLLDTSYGPFREAVYQYHREGLDRFIENPEQARQAVLQSFQKIQEAQRTTSGSLIFDTFFNAKYREIVSLFEDADPQVRLEAYNLLSEIDQGHLGEYQKLQ